MMRFAILMIMLCLNMLPLARAEQSSGESLYRVYCTQCHGVNGDGQGINAAHINVQPRSHIDKGEMSSRSDEELFKVIKQGGPAVDKSILMPAWAGNLSDEEIDQLVAYLRVLCCQD